MIAESKHYILSNDIKKVCSINKFVLKNRTNTMKPV